MRRQTNNRFNPKLAKPNPKFAKSLCQCGHVGDGPRSEHGGLLGHGPCAECDCRKFTWIHFLNAEEQSDYLATLRVVKE